MSSTSETISIDQASDDPSLEINDLGGPSEQPPRNARNKRDRSSISQANSIDQAPDDPSLEDNDTGDSSQQPPKKARNKRDRSSISQANLIDQAPDDPSPEGNDSGGPSQQPPNDQGRDPTRWSLAMCQLCYQSDFRNCDMTWDPPGGNRACGRCDRWGLECVLRNDRNTALEGDSALAGTGYYKQQLHFKRCEICEKQNLLCDRSRLCVHCIRNLGAKTARENCLWPMAKTLSNGRQTIRRETGYFDAGAARGDDKQLYFLAMGFGSADDLQRPPGAVRPGPPRPLWEHPDSWPLYLAPTEDVIEGPYGTVHRRREEEERAKAEAKERTEVEAKERAKAEAKERAKVDVEERTEVEVRTKDKRSDPLQSLSGPGLGTEDLGSSSVNSGVAEQPNSFVAAAKSSSHGGMMNQGGQPTYPAQMPPTAITTPSNGQWEDGTAGASFQFGGIEINSFSASTQSGFHGETMGKFGQPTNPGQILPVATAPQNPSMFGDIDPNDPEVVDYATAQLTDYLASLPGQ